MAGWNICVQVLKSLIDAGVGVVGAEGNSDMMVIAATGQIVEVGHGLELEFQGSFHSVVSQVGACRFELIDVEFFGELQIRMGILVGVGIGQSAAADVG